MKIYTERSRNYVHEPKKHILPAIEYFTHKIGDKKIVAFRFIFWKWWVKIFVTYNTTKK